MKKRLYGKLVTIICILMITVGIGLIAYPIVTKKYVNDKQDEMIGEVEEIIAKNVKDGTKKSDGSNNKDSVSKDKNVEAELENLEINEEDDSKYSIANMDMLNNQQVVGIISIDKLGIKFAIVEGTSRWNISAAIGHMTGTADIGETGNCVLAGHRGGVYGEFFKNIDKLQQGDKIVLKDLYGGEYSYIVYDSYVVEPNDLSVKDSDKEHDSIVTLISCENHGKQRLIVKGYLI